MSEKMNSTDLCPPFPRREAPWARQAAAEVAPGQGTPGSQQGMSPTHPLRSKCWPSLRTQLEVSPQELRSNARHFPAARGLQTRVSLPSGEAPKAPPPPQPALGGPPCPQAPSSSALPRQRGLSLLHLPASCPERAPRAAPGTRPPSQPHFAFLVDRVWPTSGLILSTGGAQTEKRARF